MEHEYIFEKPDGLYTRISYESPELANQAGECLKTLGWKMVFEEGLDSRGAMKRCEEHNKPILDGLMMGR
jgi:hypothetical protein